MRADRLVSALLELQAHGRLTGRELAERLAVSERTVQRDMEALGAAGVPVSTVAGSHGGWELDEHWRKQVPGLDEIELQALVMAPHLERAAAPAAGNAPPALSPAFRERVAAMQERLYIDPTGWNGTSENLSMLPVVQEAVWHDRKLTFRYWKAGREFVERTVDPLGLVAKGSTWYLFARTPDGFRTYRISRMEDARVLEEPCDRPADFDLESHWKASTQRFRDEISQAVEAYRRALALRLETERRAAQELEIAKQVQARLFPQVFPRLETLEYKGVCLQARHVGGDYFDFLDLGRNRLGIIVGDISGKGIAAALLMANLQANVRSQSAIALEEPQRLLRSVNQLFYSNTTPSAYTTLFFAEYDDRSRCLRYANCGHLSAILLRADGVIEFLSSNCTVLGLFEEWECAIAETHLFCGDVLLLYTDGVTETFNDSDDDFGEQRLIEALKRHRHLCPESTLGEILNEVRNFSSREQHDDITLIVAKCNPS
ncbi:MAG: SpoIIE family protein phosphatase [Acidobacteriaceae bacterium]|nr:SpoIIE family protein phosphatase [Acidobacteriaceae bacterium]MBV8569416.1 SpoIIE family protein phosphatase [Acidobacteriaceae bacterium]